MHGIGYNPFHGLANEELKNPVLHHMIVPLTIAIPSTSPDKKTLQHYCVQKMICKHIMQQHGK
ncbi:MAG TPA: hypothetical protein VJ201_04385 [Candidatus Babeliales bacterium]|nr:hypothetical protein [Candidatus Babeliales bacterium]HLC07256.1 hypothetical protein [Candidatus Babeliales bacterium]